MTNQDHGSLLNNQEDILAGLEINPASATYHAEDHCNCFDYYTPHNVSQTQFSSNYALSLPQHDQIRARLAQTQQLTNNLTQVFPNDVHTTSYEHQDTQSALSANQPSRLEQVYNENNIDLPIQAAQEGPAVGEAVIGNIGAPFDANLLQYNPAFGVPPNNGHESSNSHLNVLATPFYPPSYAANGPTDSAEQDKTSEATDGPLQNIERDVEYRPSSGDFSWQWAPYPHSNNNDGSIDEIIIASPYNNHFALSGFTSTSQYPQLYRDKLAPMSSSPQTYNAPYTQYIDNGTAFTGGMLYSPQPTTAPSQVSTSISGAGSQHEYSSSSLTPSSSVWQSRSIPSRTTGWGRRRAPSLSRSISAQTSFSHESNGSGPSRRGKRNGPMDPKRNRQAQETRTQKSVCADCKLRKVACSKTEALEICEVCKKRGLPCVKHFFFHDLNTLPEYQFGLFLINSALVPDIIKPLLTQKIDFARSLDYLDHFSQFCKIRLQSDEVWCDLDLVACRQHWQQARLDYNDPEDHCTVEDFVTNKQRWQDTMNCRALLLLPPSENNWDDPLKAFSRLDKMSGRLSYNLIGKSGSASGARPLNLQDDLEKSLYFIAMLSFERIRHYMELEAYHCLEQELVPGRVNENIRVVACLGVMLRSLRRRIAICKATRIWIYFQNGPLAKYLGSGSEASIDPPVIRQMKEFCFQLYTHFFCRFSKMNPVSRGRVSDGQKPIHPFTGMRIMEYLPTDASRQGFTNWMAEGEVPFRSPGWL
ncbi:hypothetical protein J3458_008709 [Metarhizium acridum]|uniref:uncharacterized protein n=1 Tax=Metarhizium acridum TaxID=92637 RepID=UPI001C6A8F66|nr:hypothetical protein J3458_008709 [Metarhizium acridum]